MVEKGIDDDSLRVVVVVALRDEEDLVEDRVELIRELLDRPRVEVDD